MPPLWTATGSGSSSRRSAQATMIASGSVLGTVQETVALEHRVLVPPQLSGRVTDIVASGPHRVVDTVARLELTGWLASEPQSVSYMAGSAPPAVRRATASGTADADRSACSRHILPAASRRSVWNAGRIRNRQDHHAAAAVQVGPCRRHRVRRVRRAWQRDDGNAVEAAESRGPALRPSSRRSDGSGREHVEHAGAGARGLDLYRRHDCRVLPRHGVSRRAARRQHVPLGGSVARDLRSARRDARRGGLSPVSVEPSGELLRACRPRADARRPGRDP